MRANASHAPRNSNRNRNLARNVAARGRQTCRRSESLALIRAFCASCGASTRPKTHSARKIFCVAKLAVRALSCAKKLAASDRGRGEFSRCGKIHSSAETLHSSAFLRRMPFCAKNFAREKFLAAASRVRCGRASPANAGRCSYTQNLVE
jgi:hypothetical protein